FKKPGLPPPHSAAEIHRDISLARMLHFFDDRNRARINRLANVHAQHPLRTTRSPSRQRVVTYEARPRLRVTKVPNSHRQTQNAIVMLTTAGVPGFLPSAGCLRPEI